jgi:hypothetical protein
MTTAQKNWLWFLGLVALIAGAGIYLAQSRRAEPGESFSYSMDEYRTVDPSLIKYRETAPLVPAIKNLSALAIAPDGKIYISGENAVEVFPGRTVYPVDGTPGCLAVDDDGTLFAGLPDHVEVFSREWKKTVWPSPGEKTYITSIAVDDRYVYVADAGGRRVLQYSKAGGVPYEIGTKDESGGVRGFYIPSPFFDLDIGTDGSLWVVNPGYHAFENYSRTGRLISSWERSSFSIEGFSGCCNPAHFVLLPDSSFLTAEKGLVRVKVHNQDGSLRGVVAAPDQFDDAILDVAADAGGRVYILSGNRVRVFEEKK